MYIFLPKRACAFLSTHFALRALIKGLYRFATEGLFSDPLLATALFTVPLFFRTFLCCSFLLAALCKRVGAKKERECPSQMFTIVCMVFIIIAFGDLNLLWSVFLYWITWFVWLSKKAAFSTSFWTKLINKQRFVKRWITTSLLVMIRWTAKLEQLPAGSLHAGVAGPQQSCDTGCKYSPIYCTTYIYTQEWQDLNNLVTQY